MVSHELLYFDAAGRGEAVRILLHAAGVDFTDTRFKGAEWPAIKPTTPLGQVPVLKIDEKMYCQSSDLARYAAKLAGCYPDDPLEALKSDEVMSSMNEMVGKVPFATGKSDDEKKALREEFQKGELVKYAKYVEGRIQENGGVFVTGKSLTYADLIVEGTVKMFESGFLDYFDKEFWNSYPGVMATAKAVREDAKVVAYYASLKK